MQINVLELVVQKAHDVKHQSIMLPNNEVKLDWNCYQMEKQRQLAH